MCAKWQFKIVTIVKYFWRATTCFITCEQKSKISRQHNLPQMLLTCLAVMTLDTLSNDDRLFERDNFTKN